MVWDIDRERVCGFRFRVERPCSRCVFVFNICIIVEILNVGYMRG